MGLVMFVAGVVAGAMLVSGHALAVLDDSNKRLLQACKVYDEACALLDDDDPKPPVEAPEQIEPQRIRLVA